MNGPVLLAFLMVSTLAARTQELTITVRIENMAGVPGKTLSRAEKLAGYVFLKTGVQVRWVEEGSADVPIRLLSGRPGKKFDGDAAGFAVLGPEGSAAVYYQVVMETARSLEADAAGILGAAMAHEMGHLLLRSRAHAQSGILRARIRREEARMAERGELLFTDGEAAAIREAARAREELRAHP